MTDLRFALRLLLKDRSFSVTAFLTIAVGIAANTAIFSVVRSDGYDRYDGYDTGTWNELTHVILFLRRAKARRYARAPNQIMMARRSLVPVPVVPVVRVVPVR